MLITGSKNFKRGAKFLGKKAAKIPKKMRDGAKFLGQQAVKVPRKIKNTSL